jgi:MFS family permease
MTATSPAGPAHRNPPDGRSFLSGLVHRQIDAFPATGQRLVYLALTVMATATLYYELYVTAAVNSLQLVDLHMSFLFYATLIAVSYLAGAFGSVAAGIVDRLGRVNFLVGGLVVTGVLTAWVIPACDSKMPFAIFTCMVGFVEGICLVSTPALIRDYSPQVGRATAMGFWTMGPVLGSLVVSLVGSATIDNGRPNKQNATLLDGATAWQHEYHICGVVGIVVAVLCLLFLKELSPRLRDQVLVSMHDRALIEARAAGLDLEEATRNPWRQMLKPDILISAVAISIYLLIYYTLVGTSVIYYETSFKKNFTLSQANGLGNWQWAFLLGGLIVIGALSDRFRVRKPFMVIGGVGAAIMIVIFLEQAGQAPSYGKMALIVALLSGFLGIAYTPWMASFTETIEARNPAVTANGLAIWGWIVRVVIFASFLIIPQIVSSTSQLADSGAPVLAAQAKYQTPLPDNGLPHGVLGFALGADGQPTPLVQFATKNASLLGNYTKYGEEITTLQNLPPAVVADLAAGTPKPGDLATLQATATTVAAGAQAAAPRARAAAAEAQAAGIPVQTVPVLSAPQILASLTTNRTAILQTATQLRSLAASDPAMVAQVQKNATQLGVLTVASTQADFIYLNTHGAAVQKAAGETPGQWKRWYWICFGGVIFFLLSIPLMKGHWSPSQAKAQFDEHERLVEQELAAEVARASANERVGR